MRVYVYKIHFFVLSRFAMQPTSKLVPNISLDLIDK